MSERAIAVLGLVVYFGMGIFGGSGGNVAQEERVLTFNVGEVGRSYSWWAMSRGHDHFLSLYDPQPNGKPDLFPDGSELVGTDICLMGSDGTLIFPRVENGRVWFSIPEHVVQDEYRIVSAYNDKTNPCVVIRDPDGTYRAASVRADKPMEIF